MKKNKVQMEKETTALATAQRKFVRKSVLKKVSKDLLSGNKMGRPALPDEQKREKFAIRVYVNQEELNTIKTYVGDRSASDVIRNLVLEAAAK